MGLFNLAGYFWSPKLVGWGQPGPRPTRELLGYYAGNPGRRRGRLSAEARARQTLNVWTIPGLYALYRGDALVYVGQAQALGERLLRHWRVDHLAGRWDAFTWLSPVAPRRTRGRLALPEGPVRPPAADSLAGFLDETEAFAMLVGRPVENRQSAGLGAHTWWLQQLASAFADESDTQTLAREVAALREAVTRRE